MNDADREALIRRTAAHYGVGLQAAASIVRSELGEDPGDVAWVDDDGRRVPAPPAPDADPFLPDAGDVADPFAAA